MINTFIEKAKNGNNNWLLYVATLLITFIAMQIASIPLLVYGLVINGGNMAQADISSLTSTNAGLALTLFTFAVGLVVLLWCVKVLHRKRVLDVITGRNRIDWQRVFYGAGIWAVISVIAVMMTSWFSGGQLEFQFQPAKFAGLFIVALIFIPMQTSCEEVVFRGYLMQGSALLFRSKWVALIATSLAFGLMHATNPEVEKFGFWMMIPQYVIMGLLLGYVALKDEGLELALGIHAANNLVACLLITNDDSVLQTAALFRDTNQTVSVWDSVIMLVFSIVFIMLTNLKFHFISKDKRAFSL
ncbi:MAG: CPBP family intramembrane metalloprotease [Culturomica sp.]|jgi:membrane protease YdiL (CAAX protease family)|nr:CPBP family intramembrane metalloprotease [Culturomica sp.]